MSVVIKKSICSDCIWKSSCQKLYRLRDICGQKRDEEKLDGSIKRPTDVFDIIILNCSLKDCDRSYKGSKTEGMYYCTGCNAMHHENSRIGKLHKNIVHD